MTKTSSKSKTARIVRDQREDAAARDDFIGTRDIHIGLQVADLAANAPAPVETVKAEKYVETAADRKLFKGIRESLKSDAARDYAAKQQAQFETHKQMLRCALMMKQTWSDRGIWTLIDSTWHFDSKRTLNNATDRNAVMQMNRCRINLMLNWTTDLVLTNQQKPVIAKACLAGDFQVWSCLRHDKNGATAIMLFDRAENKYMIVYEDGSFSKSRGAPRMNGEVWPVVAKITRDTIKARKAADKLEVSKDGGIAIQRYTK